MNSENQGQIDPMDFACRFFKARGAVVESRGEMKDILLPGAAARELEMEEFFRLGPGEAVDRERGGGSRGDTQVYAMQLHTPFLDRMLSLAGTATPFTPARLKFHYLKSQGFERLAAAQFDFHKSKISILNTGEARTRYLALTCRYAAQSDEIKQGLVEICINLDNGVVIPGMADTLANVQKEYFQGEGRGCTAKEIETIQAIVEHHGRQLVEARLTPFVASMNRRYRRDTVSLEAYYEALAKEMEASLEKSGLSPRLREERQAKIAMIPGELGAKKEDLLNKYSVKIDFKPVAALYLASPCVTVFARLTSGHKVSDITLTYNPATKKMDPAACESCGSGTYSLGCCANRHIICPECLAKGCVLC
ncbi:MAG: hypothetical protein WBG37_15990, partial [Desulfobacterales bacterium]